MANSKISALTSATTPLAGTETLPIVQSSTTKQVSVANLTAGRLVTSSGLTSDANVRVQYSSGGNVSLVTNNTASTAAATSQIIATNDASRNLRIQYTSSGGAGGAALTNGITTETAQIFTDGNYPIVIGTNVSAAAIIDTSQNVKLINNLVQGTAAKGINFTANTPAAGMTSQLLNWYEEGTFTPSLVPGTSGSITLTVAAAKYTRTGRAVTVTGVCEVSSVSSPVGTLFLQGLPFTNSADASSRSAAAIYATGLAAGATTSIVGRIIPSESRIRIEKYSAGSTSALAGDVQANTLIQFNLTYFV